MTLRGLLNRFLEFDRIAPEIVRYMLLVMALLLSCVALSVGAVYFSRHNSSHVYPVILLTETPHDSSLPPTLP